MSRFRTSGSRSHRVKKIGPEVLRLRSENERLRKALQPFADAVFNDNGDMTISPCHCTKDLITAYFALRRK